MECYCYLRNVQDLLSDGKSPNERRFGMPFKRSGYSVWRDGRISPYFLLKTCRNCINSVQKSYQVYSLDMRYTRGESGRVT